MVRDLAALANGRFDLLVVGGGVSGAAIAWDATLRGLRVALVEKDDFGHATSSASSKIIHGGIRYLQQGLLHRVRQSAQERATFLRIAPHLVHPVPFLVPTYGHGLRGRELLAAGMALYNLLTADCGRLEDPAKNRPGFRLLTAKEVAAGAPDVPRRNLTGGVVYHDAQMHSAERTTLAFVHAAAERGAGVANYAAVRRLASDGRRVTGAVAEDRLTGDPFEISARVVVNAAGPWALDLAVESTPHSRQPQRSFAKGIHILTRELHPRYALALATRLPNEAIINRGGRHIFLIPWRGHTLIGTTHSPFEGSPDEVGVSESDIASFLEEINRAWPAARLARGDVRFSYGGLYQLVDEDVAEGVFKSPSVYRLTDHREVEGVDGYVTAIGARYTTAPRLARECVDLVFEMIDRPPPPSTIATTPIHGGAFRESDRFFAEETRRLGPVIGAEAARELLLCYGSEYREVMAEAGEDPSWLGCVSATRPVLRASIRHAVRREMALHLADVVFRRTGIGTIGDPGDECLRECAAIMASELGWDAPRVVREIDEVRARFRPVAG